MRIEAFFIEERGGVLLAGPAAFERGIPRFTGESDLLSEVVPKGASERGTVLAVDVRGMIRRDMDDSALKVKVPGSDLWLMTCIETSDDILDVFLFNGDRILIPLHTIGSEHVLEEAYDLSDSCLPSVFVQNGSALKRKGKEDLVKVLDRMEGIGFPNTVILDTDKSMTADMWSDILESRPEIVPFVDDLSDLPLEPRNCITAHRF